MLTCKNITCLLPLLALPLASLPLRAEKVFIEENHYLCIEAEATESPLGEWIKLTSVPGYKGEAHLEFTGNTHNGGSPKSPLEYPIKIQSPGRYRLLIVSHKRLDGQPGDKCNDGWVRMSGPLQNSEAEQKILTTNQKFFGGPAEGWGFASLLDLNHEKTTAIYDLQPGNYTFTLSGRSIRWNVDRIIFFDTSKYRLNYIASLTDIPATPVSVGGKITRGPLMAPQLIARATGQKGDPLKLEALYDFQPVVAPQYVQFNPEESRGNLSIDASKHKDKFSAAKHQFSGQPGTYRFTLNTLTETDGECSYRILVDDKLVGEFKNPPTTTDYQPATFTAADIKLTPGSTITVEFNSASNGKIPEGNGFAYARGRWTGLVIEKEI